MKLVRLGASLVVVAAGLVVAACSREPRVREYDEVVIKPSPVEAAFEGSGPGAVPAPLAWQTPPGWQVLPGDGIRLAAFLLEQDGRRAETTVVMLGGAAGGVEANVARWLGQLGLQLAGDELARFLAGGAPVATRGGLRLTVYDFTRLTAADGDSMLAAVGPALDQTLFVKMSGDGALIAAARSDFLDLVGSLQLAAASTS